MTEAEEYILTFLGRCCAPSDAMPASARYVLVLVLQEVERARAALVPGSAGAELCELMIKAGDHAVFDGCLCQVAEVIAQRRALEDAGLL